MLVRQYRSQPARHVVLHQGTVAAYGRAAPRPDAEYRVGGGIAGRAAPGRVRGGQARRGGAEPHAGGRSRRIWCHLQSCAPDRRAGWTISETGICKIAERFGMDLDSYDARTVAAGAIKRMVEPEEVASISRAKVSGATTGSIGVGLWRPQYALSFARRGALALRRAHGIRGY